MAVIYLIRTPGEDNEVYYKIGYANNFLLRLKAYITHNPAVKILGTMEVYKKTKHQLETAIHKEVKEKGYNFIVRFGTVTEWFSVEKKSPIDEALQGEKGLMFFDSCKDRKYIKWTV